MECNTGLADTQMGTPNEINVPGICTKVDTKPFKKQYNQIKQYLLKTENQV